MFLVTHLQANTFLFFFFFFFFFLPHGAPGGILVFLEFAIVSIFYSIKRVFHTLLKNHCACTSIMEFVKSQNGKNKHNGWKDTKQNLNGNRKVKTTEVG